jgi:hypothetical protein
MEEKQKNVLGFDIATCGMDPVTGFYRDGCCNTGNGDIGTHTVCAIVTSKFSEYSKEQGNDLTTPRPEFNFKGLKDGDSWCLCAFRWKEAYKAGCAPRVKLTATNIKTLEYIKLDDLKSHQADLN